MPRPSTGSLPNAGTLLNAFGERVQLEDGSEIDAIVSQRKELTYSGSEAREVMHTVLSVPVVSQGSLRQGQTVTARGVSYYAANVLDVGDGWQEFPLSAVGG